MEYFLFVFFFSSRRRHTRSYGDWSSDVCSSDLAGDLDAFDRRYSVNGGGQTLYQQYGAASSFLSVAKPQGAPANSAGWAGEIGRASCRERVKHTVVTETVTNKDADMKIRDWIRT